MPRQWRLLLLLLAVPSRCALPPQDELGTDQTLCRAAPEPVAEPPSRPLPPLGVELRRRLRWFLTHYRLTAFTSELGESLRPVVASAWVSASYLVSWLYVTLDVVIHGFEVHDLTPSARAVRRAVLHASTFQAVATMLLPAAFIHSVVHAAQHVLLHARLGYASPPHLLGWRRWVPTGCGIACIPLVPVLFDHPVEAIVDRAFGGPRGAPAAEPAPAGAAAGGPAAGGAPEQSSPAPG